jgi:hypothetical protein
VKSLLRKFWGRHHDLVNPLSNICVTNDHGHETVSRNHNSVFPYSWPIVRFVTREKRRVPLAEYEQLTSPEFVSSHSIVCMVCVDPSFCVVFCRLLFLCPFLTAELSVLRSITSVFHFGIFKLFLNVKCFVVYAIWLNLPLSWDDTD